MDISQDGVLAAGTFTRCIGLFSDEGQGDAIALFSIAGEEGGKPEEGGIGGSGITQCIWSPCGTYLYVIERCSDGALIYDVRVTGKKLGWLKGRKALTNQRHHLEVVPSGGGEASTGHEVWAGGTDGVVRVWKSPYEREGAISPDKEWKLHDGQSPIFAGCPRMN